MVQWFGSLRGQGFDPWPRLSGLKDLVLPQLQLRFNPQSEIFLMPWVWPFKKKEEKKKKKRLSSLVTSLD